MGAVCTSSNKMGHPDSREIVVPLFDKDIFFIGVCIREYEILVNDFTWTDFLDGYWVLVDENFPLTKFQKEVINNIIGSKEKILKRALDALSKEILER